MNARTFTHAVPGAVCLAVLLIGGAPLDVEAQLRRSYAADQHALSIDGSNVSIRAVEGGRIIGEVVVQPGRDGFAAKHVAGVRYEPLIVEATIGEKPLTDWIAAAWSGKASAKRVTLLIADQNFKVQSGLELSNAVIAETRIPTLDGASKAPGTLSVVIAPEAIRALPGTGADIRGGVNVKKTPWLTSNFRMQLGDLPTTRVARIDSFTVRTPALASPGTARERRVAPGGPEFPNLTVHLSSADAKPWSDWHNEFVVQGKNGNEQEKNGAIALLTPNGQDELARIALSHCGIISVGPASPSSPDQLARTVVQLYCERMEFIAAAQ